MAAKGVLESTFLNTKMTNGTPYSLVDLTDTCTLRPLLVHKTASAQEVFHLGQGPSALKTSVKRCGMPY